MNPDSLHRPFFTVYVAGFVIHRQTVHMHRQTIPHTPANRTYTGKPSFWTVRRCMCTYTGKPTLYPRHYAAPPSLPSPVLPSPPIASSPPFFSSPFLPSQPTCPSRAFPWRLESRLGVQNQMLEPWIAESSHRAQNRILQERGLELVPRIERWIAESSPRWSDPGAPNGINIMKFLVFSWIREVFSGFWTCMDRQTRHTPANLPKVQFDGACHTPANRLYGEFDIAR